MVSPPGLANLPGRARAVVALGLADWRLYALVDDAVTCANELVINAVVHAVPVSSVGEPRVTVVMHRCRGSVCVEVGDDDPRRPRPVAADPDGLVVSGRGLAMVAALADGWETVPAGAGKLVRCWFNLARYGLAARDLLPVPAVPQVGASVQ